MKEYDVIVIGAGAAGLTAAGVSASLGAKTAMIEARKNGGDCTWYGCIPSKTLIHAATTAWQARKAKNFGINIPEISVDFPALMKHIRSVQEHIYNEADAPAVYERMGVEVISGRASFVDEHTISIRRTRSTTDGQGEIFCHRHRKPASYPPHRRTSGY